METKKRTVEVRVIEAAPGHLLIHRDSLGSDNPYYTERVWLGAADSPDNYVEVDASEAQTSRQQ